MMVRGAGLLARHRAQVAELLLARGALVSSHKTNGWTPLMFACLKGHAAMAGLLIVHGASLTDCNVDGQNSFYITSREGQLELLAALLHQPLPAHGGGGSSTAATFAASLLESRTMNNKTPLHGAAVNGQVGRTPHTQASQPVPCCSAVGLPQ